MKRFYEAWLSKNVGYHGWSTATNFETALAKLR